jgi:hypothetical protein
LPDIGTREEHLAWAKARAADYLQAGEVEQAFTSLVSDLRKHSGTRDLVMEVGEKSLQGLNEMAARAYVESLQ